MKRALSLLLAILMLAGLAVLFASCKNEVDGIVTFSGGTEKLDLSGYALLYGESQNGDAYTSTFQAQLNGFAEALGEKMGKSFNPRQVERSDLQEKEILIGLTDREESKKAHAQIAGEGFAIRVIGGKIVIVGTDNLFTLMALQYFKEKYLGGEQVQLLELYESAEAENVGTLTLADSSKNTPADVENVFTYVCSHKLASLAPAYAGTGSTSNISGYEEYPQIALTQIVQKMEAQSGLGGKYFPSDTDKKEHAREVLVGMTDREECKTALSGVAGDEYVVRVLGERVAVTSWSEAGLKKAVAAYLDLMSEATKKQEGKTVVVLPQGFCLVGDASDVWEIDFPQPTGEGISLYNTMDANDNALQFLYTGEGVNADSYNAYCRELEAAGYAVYMQSEAEGSIFKTYVNEEKQHSLYVAYNAYAHKNDYNNSTYNWALSKTKTGDKNVYKYDPCFRIVSAPLESAYLPEEELLTPQNYQKKTDSMVTTLPLYGKAVGLSYIVTLEDGSFVVFDGGNMTTDGPEHSLLWRALCTLYENIYKQSPTQKEPVRIAAWVLTHAHGDHYRVFKKLADTYGSTGLLQVDRMIANIPAVDSAYTISSIAKLMTPAHVKSLQNSIKGGFDYIKVHTGQKFYIANLEIEVITTWEDLNPLVANNTNDTNTVLRFTLTNKNEPSAKVTQMWTGDANRWQSRFMCATYGDYLKSDMVSVAHHGNNGCEVEFYAMVSPTTVWWPNTAGSAKSYLNPSKYKSDFRHQTDQYLCNELESVKYVYTAGVAGGSVGNLNHFTTLVLKASGPDYENIYDLLTGEKLTYTDISAGAYATVSDCMKK